MTKITVNHAEIYRWAGRHNACPAELPHLQTGPTLLHFIFGNGVENLEQLQPITWEAFFMLFELLSMSFSYSESPGFVLTPNSRTL